MRFGSHCPSECQNVLTEVWKESPQIKCLACYRFSRRFFRSWDKPTPVNSLEAKCKLTKVKCFSSKKVYRLPHFYYFSPLPPHHHHISFVFPLPPPPPPQFSCFPSSTTTTTFVLFSLFHHHHHHPHVSTVCPPPSPPPPHFFWFFSSTTTTTTTFLLGTQDATTRPRPERLRAKSKRI